jgi:hypothetical protein
MLGRSTAIDSEPYLPKRFVQQETVHA